MLAVFCTCATHACCKYHLHVVLFVSEYSIWIIIFLLSYLINIYLKFSV